LKAWQNGHDGILLQVFSRRGPTSSTPHSGPNPPAARDAVGTASIKVDIVANRTTTIKASVEDVERTLALTIALVVMVIFLFLRNAGDHHPGRHGAAVPARHRRHDVRAQLQLGQFVAHGVDHRRRLSWSMMPSSCWRISIGTSRRACSPLDATLRGGRIGFTILTISISLVAFHSPSIDGRHHRTVVP